MPSAPAASPGPGTVLGGRFRVVRPIGEGGMGLVLEAENMVTGKRVAVKWMRREIAARSEAIERFMREARASARVRHPNVVDVYDVVQDGETVFMVMELLEGEPLSAVLERGGMPAHELVALLLDAMRGVAAAHKQGVIHRDIKPDNIFLAQEGDRATRTPKVVDFGISKLNDGEALSLTRTGTTMGTPLYMSFEQLRAARDVDARTDVYAFGVILYEALTGRPPFEAETFTELVIKITTTKPTPPKSLRSDIPRSLDTLIQKAMAKERDDRHPSLEALIAELTRFSTEALFRAQMTADAAPVPRVVSPFAAAAPAPAVILTERSEAQSIDTPMNASVSVPSIPRRRDAGPWLTGAIAIGVLIAGLSWYGTQTRESTEPPVLKPAPAVPQPTAAGLQPSAASVPSQLRGAELPAAELPRGELPPAELPEPVSESKPATPKPKPLAPHATEAPQPARPSMPPARDGARAKAESVEVSARPQQPPKPAPVAEPTRPAQPPAQVPDAEEKRLKPRAGRPRSQDF